MELTIKEQAVIKAFRAIEEAPANILLWYAAGLEANAEKTVKHDPARAQNDYDNAKVIWEHMRDINTL